MSQAFDSTVKDLLELDHASWPALIDLPLRPATLIDADLSTVSAATDKVLRLSDPDELLAVDFQAGPFANLPLRTCKYNLLLADRHQLPVRSLVVLLRPEANLPAIDGRLRRTYTDETEPYLQFRYHVVLIWQQPVERLLAGGLSLLALALIADVRTSDLPRVIRRMSDRLRNVDPAVARQVWSSAFILAGLRYDEGILNRIFAEVLGMEESSTYQAILRKGKVEGRLEGKTEGKTEGQLEMALWFAEQKFGEPSARVRKRIARLTPAALEQLKQQIVRCNSWDEVFPSRRRGS